MDRSSEVIGMTRNPRSACGTR